LTLFWLFAPPTHLVQQNKCFPFIGGGGDKNTAAPRVNPPLVRSIRGVRCRSSHSRRRSRTHHTPLPRNKTKTKMFISIFPPQNTKPKNQKPSRDRLDNLQKAAAAGDAKAMSDLGATYAIGEAVPQSWAEAFKWFKSAAEANFTLAYVNLAGCYRDGDGVTKDQGGGAVQV
jgi:hypothetical protein